MTETSTVQWSIGTSLSDAVIAYQHLANAAIKGTNGDTSKVFRVVLGELNRVGAITDKDIVSLSAFYDDFAKSGNKPTRRTQTTARNRYVRMLADEKTSQVARMLAEFYQALLNGTIPPGPRMQEMRSAARSNWAPIVFWAGVGALIGYANGGYAGAAIGALVGAAVGVCVA